MSAPSPKFAVLRREGRPTEFRSAEAAERVSDRIEDSGDAESAASSVGALDGAGDPRERAPLLVEKGDELELLPWPESGEDVHHDELDDAMENAKKAGGPADPNKKHFSPVKLRAHALT